jgi:hypothetical protein
MDRTYNFAGISKLNGKYKVRFSDRATYVKNLQVAGNTDIDLMELKEPMTKIDAVKYMLAINFDNGNAEIRSALESNLEVRADRARAKTAPIDDPVVYMREICTRLRELNELVARMTVFADDMDDDDDAPNPVPVAAGVDDEDDDAPF